MTDADALLAFLRVQLDEQAAEAQGTVDGNATARAKGLSSTLWDEQDAAATRVLREVEAKRRLLDHIAGEFGGRLQIHDGDQWVDHGEIMLRLLATPYADQPGYRNEWRPA